MTPIKTDQPIFPVSANQTLDALVCQLVTKLEAGEAVDLSILAADHPEHLNYLQKLLPTLEAMANLGYASELENDSANGAQERSSHRATDDRFSGYLGDYRIICELGRGGMGVVYEAEQVSLGRRVALKVLPLAATLNSQQLQRFKNEARAAAALNHPHIVGVHSVGMERGVHYFAMQLIEGQSLAGF